MALHWKIIIGMLLGVAWAFFSSYQGISGFNIDWVMPFGTIFINLMKLIAMPLVLFSIIKGMVELQDLTKLGRMGAKTVVTYLITTVLAVSTGLVLVNVLQPGDTVSDEQRTVNRLSYEIWVEETEGVDYLDDKRFRTDPQYADMVGAAESKLREQQTSDIVVKNIGRTEKVKKEGPLQFVIDMIPDNIFLSLTDMLMLQVIFFAIFFGITLVMIPKDKGEPVIRFVDGANDVFLKMVEIVMAAAPFFVFTLMAGKLSELAGNDPQALFETLKGLATYMLVVIGGLGLLIFVVYPLIMVFVTARTYGIGYGKAYSRFFKAMGPAQLLAFSTSSSAATLPVTMECVRDRLGVSRETTSFVLPIGATVNMDGTSLYQAVAVIFLAQFHMIDLEISQQAIIVLTATLASIGSAAVPSAGLIMLILVLQSVGLNPAWIAIIFPVDRLLDMCRTVVNVTGDAMVSTIIGSTEGHIENIPEEEWYD